MNLLQPAYLWALAAMAVPLAIHLLSRKEGRVIRIGSLRHIRETPTRQFRSIRLNEYLLLALRMITLALLVLFLAGWYMTDLNDRDKWLVIEPGLENRSELIPLFDSLESSGYAQVWLLPGFPARAERVRPVELDYAARLNELQTLPVAEAVVVATNRVGGFRGPKESLPENVRWIDVPPSSSEVPVRRVQKAADSVDVRMGFFKPDRTSFRSYVSAGKDGRVPDTVKVVLVSEPEFEADKNALQAIFTVIRRRSVDELSVEVIPANKTGAAEADFLFWLSQEPIPYTDAVTFYFEDRAGGPEIEPMPSGRYRITGRLNSETVLSQNIAVRLMEIVMADPASKARADSLDARVFPMKATFTESAQLPVLPAGNRASTWYLFAALLFVFLLERFVAYRRNQ